MVNHVLLAACLLGAACPGQAAEFGPPPRQVGECPFTLVFPGAPRSSNEKNKLLPPSVDRALNLAYEVPGKAAFTASCGCSDTQTFDDMTAAGARQGLEDSIGQANTTLLHARFRDDSELGKMIAWEGEAPSAFGLLKVWGRRYYAGSCILQATAGGPVGKVDAQQVTRFLESAKRVAAPAETAASQTPAPATPAPTSPAPAGPAPASPAPASPTGASLTAASPAPTAKAPRGLQVLQALADKKLIATEDYERLRGDLMQTDPTGNAALPPSEVALILAQAGGLLAARFADDMMPALASKRSFRLADFASSEDVIAFLSAFDKDNGHALYYGGEIARKTGAADKGHALFQAYLAAEATLGATARSGGIGIAACQTPKGYCRQRTAWIDRLLATDLYQDTLAKKKAARPGANKTSGAGRQDSAAAAAFADDFRKALGYACDALKLYGSELRDRQQLAPTTKLVAELKTELGGQGCP